MKKLRFGSLTEEDKREICEWHYEGQYELYNLPSFAEMKERKIGFLHPVRAENFLGFWEDRILIGYVNLREEEKEVFVGIGVRPEFCGLGFGSQILMEVSLIAKEKYPEKPLYLEVRCWNKRAVRCYEKAGFSMEGSAYFRQTPAGSDWFYRMVKK